MINPDTKEIWVFPGTAQDGSCEWQFSDAPDGQQTRSDDYVDLAKGLTDYSGYVIHMEQPKAPKPSIDLRFCTCIKCDKQLQNQGVSDYNPSGGIVFGSHGNYGCTVFDPVIGHQKLEIVLCDKCLTESANDFQVLLLGAEGGPRYFDPVKD
jgi:hypothetical protein